MAAAHALTSPLGTWFRDPAAFRRRALGHTPAVLAPRDRAWRAIAPDFAACVEMAGSGLPFQITAERRVDRSGDPRRLAAALAAGRTVYLPQVHQVLPRLMRLMVALRAAFFRPAASAAREECSFLFVVEGTGRQGMGLHHDGAVDAFWLQLEGRRTVTIGPRVRRGTPEELDDRAGRGGRRAGWRTFDLEPGSLFHLPAWTPHAVVCRQRSLAITLTWARAAAPARRAARGRKSPLAGLLAWDVVSGFAEPIPPARPATLWTQVPLLARRGGRSAALRVFTPDGEGPRLPPAARSVADQLTDMPWLRRRDARAAGLEPLVDAGLLGPRDLPLRIRPDDPAALDGWRFA
jgi:mannose-6-phosphate isomerase-like protein (cupin superfamily)